MRFMHLKRPLARVFGAAAPPEDSKTPDPKLAPAAADHDHALRADAVRELPDGEELRRLAGLCVGTPATPTRAPSPGLDRIAQERLARLIDAGSVDFAGLPRDQLSALLSVAALCSDAGHLSEALASVDDLPQLARLVIEGSSSRLRQLAARRIEDPAQLRQLLKEARGHDKSVYKIIKEKCDLLRAEEQRTAHIADDLTAACASLERHGQRIFDAIYVPSFEHFAARWRTLEAHAASDLRDRAQQAIERCRKVIAEHDRQMAQQAADAAHQVARQAALEDAAARAEADARERREAATLAAAESARVRAAEEQARADKNAAAALAQRRINALIGRAKGALRDGNTGRAAGLRRAIEQKLSDLPAAPASLAGQVQKLDEKLNELKEWKDYAVAPKRAALIAEMEALLGSAEEPRALANRIKQLREEWKAISIGIISDSEADWQRFHRAAVAAYRPCRDYFKAQARVRRDNVAKRRAVLERLQIFERAQGDEHPDWRAVAAVLREAPQEWRQYFPVDRVAGAAVQVELDASMARLQARLDAWHAQNVDKKTALIRRAQHLGTLVDHREAVETVKRLQLEWKEIGAAQRDQEQRLWNEFRERCDAVFQKRQAAYAERAAGLESNKAKALALCAEAEQVAALDGAALLDGATRIPEWRAAFEALGELPRADARTLNDRFERALKRCQTKLAEERVRDRQRSFTDLLEAARRIQAYAWAVAEAGEPSERELLKETAESFIAGVRQWPKGGAQALKLAWERAAAGAQGQGAQGTQGTQRAQHTPGTEGARGAQDPLAHETALRLLCVRAEILADLPSPAEDQPLRRAHQVQRLMERMGQHIDAGSDERDGLVFEWLRVGPVAPELHAALLARFLRCRKSAAVP